MLAVTLTLSTVISIMFLLVGGVIGYLLKEYVIERNSTFIPTHPEMFDENGQIIPDDILAVRFENSLDDFSDTEDWHGKINILNWPKIIRKMTTSTKTKTKLPPNPFVHEVLDHISKQRSGAKKIEWFCPKTIRTIT